MSPNGPRLPVYLVLDCSGSMVGDAGQALAVAVRLLADDLHADPYSAETVWAAAVTFGGVADEAVPLTPAPEFHPPPLEARGASPLGAALRLVGELIPRDRAAGDYRPVVFVATDGEPSDRWQPAARRLGAVAKLVLCGCGRLVAPAPEFPGGFVRLRDAGAGAFREFLEWAEPAAVGVA